MDNGLPSTTRGSVPFASRPRYVPSFQQYHRIRQPDAPTLRSVFSPAKARDLHCPSEHWHDSLDSLDLMAGLAISIDDLKIPAPEATPTLNQPWSPA